MNVVYLIFWILIDRDSSWSHARLLCVTFSRRFNPNQAACACCTVQYVPCRQPRDALKRQHDIGWQSPRTFWKQAGSSPANRTANPRGLEPLKRESLDRVTRYCIRMKYDLGTKGKIRRQTNMTARQTANFLVILFLGTVSLRCDGGWVDPDTPIHYQMTEAMTRGDDRQYKVVRHPRNY